MDAGDTITCTQVGSDRQVLIDLVPSALKTIAQIQQAVDQDDHGRIVELWTDNGPSGYSQLMSLASRASEYSPELGSVITIAVTEAGLALVSAGRLAMQNCCSNEIFMVLTRMLQVFISHLNSNDPRVTGSIADAVLDTYVDLGRKRFEAKDVMLLYLQALTTWAESLCSSEHKSSYMDALARLDGRLQTVRDRQKAAQV